MSGPTLRLQLPTAQDTAQLGRRLAALLRPGDLIVLAGPLGAGKTVLAQGLGAGLGVRSAIVSPTFVIARVHPEGRVPLVHVDAYRLGSLAEVDDLDLDVSADASVTVVEWGEGRAEQLTDAWLTVRLDRSRAVGRDPGASDPATSDPADSDPADRDEPRIAELEPHGGDWAVRLRTLLATSSD